jgi:hypothetical protein
MVRWVVCAAVVAVAAGVAWRGWVPPVLAGPPGVLYFQELSNTTQAKLVNLVAADAACGRAGAAGVTWAAPGASMTAGLSSACGATLGAVAALCGVLCEALEQECVGTVTQVPGCPVGAVSRRGALLDAGLHWCTLVPRSNSTAIAVAALATGPPLQQGSNQPWTPRWDATGCVAVGLRESAEREAAAPTAVLTEVGTAVTCPFLAAGVLWWFGARWPGPPDPTGCVLGPTPVHGLAATADAAVGGLAHRAAAVSVSLGEFAAAASRGAGVQVSVAAVTEAVVCVSGELLPWECLCGRTVGGVGPVCAVPVPQCMGDFVGTATGPPPPGVVTAATGAADPRVVAWRGGSPPVFGVPVLTAQVVGGSWGWATAAGAAPVGVPVCVPGGCVNGGAGPTCGDTPCNPEAAGGYALAECGGPGVGHCAPGTPGSCECEAGTWADPWTKCAQCLPGAVRRNGVCVWDTDACFAAGTGLWPAQPCSGAGTCLLPGQYPGVRVQRAACVCDVGRVGTTCAGVTQCAGGEGPLGTQVCEVDVPSASCGYFVVALPLGTVGGGAADGFLDAGEVHSLGLQDDGWVAFADGAVVSLATAAERVCRVARGAVATLQGVPTAHVDSGSGSGSVGSYDGSELSVSVLPVWVEESGLDAAPPTGWTHPVAWEWPGMVAARVAQTMRVGAGVLGAPAVPQVPPVVLCEVPGCELSPAGVTVRVAGLGVIPGGLTAAPVTLNALLAGGTTWAGPALSVAVEGRSSVLARVCADTWGVLAPMEATVWAERVPCGRLPGPELCGKPTGTAAEVLSWVRAQVRFTGLLVNEVRTEPWTGLRTPVVFTAWVGVPGQSAVRVWAQLRDNNTIEAVDAQATNLRDVGSVVGLCGDGVPVAFPVRIPAQAWIVGGVV